MKNPVQNNSLMRLLVKRWPVIVAAIIVCSLAAAKYLQYVTPQYESTAKIKLADSKEGVPNSNLYKDFDVFATNSKIGTEVELLKSEVLIDKILDKVNIGTSIYRVGDIHKKELYDESPFIITVLNMDNTHYDKVFKMTVSGKSILDIQTPNGSTLKAQMGQMVHLGNTVLGIRLNRELIAAKPNLAIDDHYEFVINSRRHLIDNIISNMDVMSVEKDVPVLRVSYKSPVARKSADIVNAVADAYINDYIDEKYRSADTTENFLTDQLKEYSGKLSSSETQIQNYRDAHNIINIPQETETDLRKIADLKKQLANVQMNLLAIDSLNKYIKKGKDNFTSLAPNFEAFTDLLSTEMVKEMKHLQADKEDLMTRYTPEHEKVQVIDRKISDLSSYMVESIHNTETNLRIKYDDLRNTIAQSEEAFIGLPEKEKTMTILERNFSLNEQIYRFLQEKRTDAKIAKAATISFHRIISRGEVPRSPVSPNAKLVIVFSGFLGFIFSIAGLVSLRSLKGRADSETSIYRNSDTPVGFVLPFAKDEKSRRLAFNRWALELEVKGKLNNGTILCFSSFKTGEGKQFCAVGLAKAATALSKKVLYIGMDGHMEDKQGYETLTADRISANWQMPAVWKQQMERLRKEYDVIIIKNFPLDDENYGITPMTASDVNYFIIDSNLTKISDIIAADELKAQIAADNMEFVYNRAGYHPGIAETIRKTFENIRHASRKA